MHIEKPLKAIRAKCIECCCKRLSEVRECKSEECPLHPFRMGKNPFRAKRVMSDEEKAAIAERFRKAKELHISDEG